MDTPSVIVVGAGPAGSTAARLLAEDGARVTLLEARQLPRDKACAGGLTAKAVRRLPESVLETSELVVHKFEVSGGRLPPVRIDEADAEITMIRRATFDHAMAEAAAIAGAAVYDGDRVIRVIEEEGGVTATTRHGTVRADYLIAADGEPSGTARALGLGGVPARRSLTLSAQVQPSTSRVDDTAVVSFAVERGYAWYFPRGNHASIGVGSAVPSGRSGQSVGALRDALGKFAERSGVTLDSDDITCHWLPQGIRPGRLVSRRCMLAGDAAGMADPLLGEGIAYAIRTGEMAAHAIRDAADGQVADLSPYETILRASFRGSMRRLGFAARVVEWSPTFALAAARLSPWVRAYGANVLSGRRAPFTFDACEGRRSPAEATRTLDA